LLSRHRHRHRHRLHYLCFPPLLRSLALTCTENATGWVLRVCRSRLSMVSVVY
jgi:hypothetical protein